MYLDGSRIADLEELKAIRDNPKETHEHRKRASKAFDKIVRQSQDRNLTELRERLRKATYASDKHAIWQITNQIKQYMHEEGIDKEK